MKTILSTLLIVSTLSLAVWYLRYYKADQPFQELIDYYSQNPADSLKLKAACFLIEHSQWHYGIENHIVDATGKRIEHLPAEFLKDSIQLTNRMEQSGYHFLKGTPTPDRDVLTTEYLKENIELAFLVWQKPWCKHLTFDKFCEYILPYRCQTEPLSSWRIYFYEKYKWIEDSVQNPTSTLEVCNLLQKELQKNIGYLDQAPLPYSGFLAPLELEKIKYGICENHANYITLAMRALGIPTTYLHVPLWGCSNHGHALNMILTNDSARYYSFTVLYTPPLAISQNPDLACRAFIHVFAKQHVSDAIPSNNIPGHLRMEFKKDITARFCPTDTLKFPVSKLTSTDNTLYLCTFSSGEWQPINYSRITNHALTFHPVTRDLLYCIAQPKDRSYKPISQPFIFVNRDTLLFKYMNNEVIPDAIVGCQAKAGDPPTTKKTFLYSDNNSWKKIIGDAILEVRINGKWGTYDAQEGEYYRYRVTLKNVPKNTIFYAGGSNRLYATDQNGKVKCY